MKVRSEAQPASTRADEELLDRLGRLIEPDDAGLQPWYAGYRKTHRERLAVDLRIVEEHVSAGARVLEYGSVPTLMTAALEQSGFAVSSLDLAPDRFSRSIERLGLDVRRCDVEREDVPFDAGTFDAVLFNELFEHLRIDPMFTLREARRVLKHGGKLLLSTPNLRSFRGIRNLVVRDRGHASTGGVYEQYEKLEALGHMGHVREYTSTEVAEFLSRVGFQVETVIFRGGHGAGVVGLAERLLPRFRPSFTLVGRAC